MKTTDLMTVATLLLLTLSTPAQALDQEQASPPIQSETLNFSGQWILNKELSQDFAAIMRKSMGGGRGGGVGGGMNGGRGGSMGNGMGGGMGGGAGGMGGDEMGDGGMPGGGGMRDGGMRGAGGQRPDGANENMAKAQERALRMQKEYSRLEIFHDDPELNLTNGLDISQLHFTDGRESSIWTERGEMKARTNWEGRALCIRTTGSGDRGALPGRVRTFSLSPDGSQLILVEERPLPDKKEPVTVRMVYDRAK